MAREIDPSDKMQLRSRGGLLFPGTCCICGGSDEERTYVDLGVFYDYEGQQYICNICGTHLGEILGLFTPEEVAKDQEKLNELLVFTAALEKKLDEQQPVIDLLRTLSVPYDNAILTGDSTGEALVETSEPTAEESVTGEPEVTEHLSESRRSDANGDESGDGSSHRVFTFD